MKKITPHHRILFVLLLFMTKAVWSQSVFGKWKTIDDRTGIEKAIVEVYKKNGMLQARIRKILEKGRENAVCIKCEGELKDKPIVGMKIISDFKKNGDGEYKGNQLFDPEYAKTYRGKVWLDPSNANKLKVRGYIAFLYRTQTWHRVKEE